MRTWTEEQRRQQSDKMRRIWADPAYAERHRQRGKDLCAMMASDPAIIARRRANHAAAVRRNYQDPAFRARIGCLPPMTPDERRLYRKLTTNGATRADALKAMGKE